MYELTAEIRARGTVAMIPSDLCKRDRIGRDRVAHVLLAYADAADHRCIAWPGLSTLAADLGLSKRDVQTSRDLLIEARIITPAGRVGRANAYLLDVDAWPERAPVDKSHEGTGERTGKGTGKGTGRSTGIPVANRTEPNPSLPDAPLPGVLVGVATAPKRTDGHPEEDETDTAADAARVVLADVPTAKHPRDRAGLADVLTIATRNGWTPAALRADLATARHNYDAVGGGAVLAYLRAAAQRPGPGLPKAVRPPCGDCNDTGWRDPDADRLERCPSCHPAAGTEKPLKTAATPKPFGLDPANRFDRLFANG